MYETCQESLWQTNTSRLFVLMGIRMKRHASIHRLQAVKRVVFTPNINVSVNCMCAYDSLVAVMLVF